MNGKIEIRDIRQAPFFWINRELLGTIQPTWRAILAYTAVAYFCMDGVSSSVDIEKLANTVNVSRATMKRGLKELADKKAIKITPHVKIRGGKKTTMPNRYTLISISSKEQSKI